MTSSTVSSKSPPVLLPNAKKPSLLKRLFSTERKSSIYAMPTVVALTDDDHVTDIDGDEASGGGGDAHRQHQRQMKRLQSVDSATMQRDRDALLKEQRTQRHRVKQHRLPTDDGHHQNVSTAPERASNQNHPCSVPAATGNETAKPGSCPRKQSMPAAMKLQLHPKSPSSSSSSSNETSPSDKSMKSPTDSSRSPSLSPATASVVTQAQAPGQRQSDQRKNSLPTTTAPTKSGVKKSPTRTPDTETTKPPMSLTPDSGSSADKRQTSSKKRPSMSSEASLLHSQGKPQQQQQQAKNKPSKPGKGNRKLKHRKQKSAQPDVHVDTSRPLEYPTTPDYISEYHRQKPFLNRNEEWIIVELLEYECMVDGLEIIKMIAKHSKFFEVEPDELWEEFFEFVENVPSYDEIINFDVWQEFLLEKYNC